MATALRDEPKVDVRGQARPARFQSAERDVLERFMPGLDDALRSIPLGVLEGRENPSIRLLKEARGPALLIPKRYGGLGATAVEGARTLRAIASRAPSLGIVCTTHSFSVSTLVEWAVFGEEYGEYLLTGMAEGSMYLASGFAEGRSGARPLDMTTKARRAPGGGWLINGKKKPCTLAYSMDFLTCGVSVEAEDGTRRRAVGLVPADSPGIERRPFWKSHVLAGAESEEVILTDVHVPDDFVFVVEGSAHLDPVEVTGYIWLQLALSSTYPRRAPPGISPRPGGTAGSPGTKKASSPMPSSATSAPTSVISSARRGSGRRSAGSTARPRRSSRCSSRS